MVTPYPFRTVRKKPWGPRPPRLLPARPLPASLPADRRNPPRGPHDPPGRPDCRPRAPIHRRPADPRRRRIAPRVRLGREWDRRDRPRLRPHLDRGPRRTPPPARLGLVARGHRDGPVDRGKLRVADYGGVPPSLFFFSFLLAASLP